MNSSLLFASSIYFGFASYNADYTDADSANFDDKVSMLMNSFEYCLIFLVLFIAMLGNFVSQWMFSLEFRESFKDTVVAVLKCDWETRKISQKASDIIASEIGSKSSEISQSPVFIQKYPIITRKYKLPREYHANSIRPVSISSETNSTSTASSEYSFSQKPRNIIERSLTQYKIKSKSYKIEKSNSLVIKRDRVDLERRDILDKINRNLKMAVNDDFFMENCSKVVEYGSLRQKTNFGARNKTFAHN